MMYYIEYNGDIALFDNDRERLAHTQEVFPIFHGLEIKETDRPIENYRFADDEDYIIEKQAKERARLDQLCLTPSDVERALYYGMGMDFDDLKQFVMWAHFISAWRNSITVRLLHDSRHYSKAEGRVPWPRQYKTLYTVHLHIAHGCY